VEYKQFYMKQQQQKEEQISVRGASSKFGTSAGLTSCSHQTQTSGLNPAEAMITNYYDMSDRSGPTMTVGARF